MVESKSKDDTTTVTNRRLQRAGDISKLYDTVDENLVKTIEEVARVQPIYRQGSQVHTYCKECGSSAKIRFYQTNRLIVLKIPSQINHDND